MFEPDVIMTTTMMIITMNSVSSSSSNTNNASLCLCVFSLYPSSLCTPRPFKKYIYLYLRSRYFLFLKHRRHKTSFRELKNECCWPHKLNISNVNFTTKNLYRQSQYSRTWNGRCLALIAQVVRGFGMNPEVVGSSCPGLQKTLAQYEISVRNAS